jgi:glycosyltransferase involved in cell wall biosynthesis
MARINWIRSLYLLIPVVLVLFQLYHVHDCPHQPFGEPKVSGRVRGGVGQQDDSPLISVIIPVGPSKHKRQEAVLQAIYSAANQTYPNVEVIVVDVSGQNNIQAALTEKTRHPIKVLAITQPNGVYAGYVRNYGIQASKGDYLAFLDADDAFLPRKLELHMQYARALDVSDFSSTEAYYAKECRFQEGGVVAPWKLEQEDAIHNPETFPLYNAEKFKPVLARKAKKNQMLRDGANLPALWDLELMNWHNCAITR